MSVNVETNVMRPDPPKGHLVNGKNGASSSGMESIAAKHGVVIKASDLKLRSDVTGVESAKTSKLIEELMGESRENKEKSFAGFYTYFLASDVDSLSKEDISRRFQELVLKALYTGSSGNVLDRINAVRQGGKSTNGLSRYMFAHSPELRNKDVMVIWWTFVYPDGTPVGKDVCTTIEHELHDYCESNRADGLRFTAAEYSAVGGKNGQNTAKVVNTVSTMSAQECDELIMQAIARKVELEFSILKDKVMGCLTMNEEG